MIYNVYGGTMKKVITIIMILLCFCIITFVVFTKADNNVLTKEEALHLGEEKYLKFLWMVDGAFNSERLNGDFLVNNKRLSDEDKVFTCKYKNNKTSECVGNNFEVEFKKLFSNNINYERVYSDGTIYDWITFKNGDYYFNNLNTCNIKRMELNHSLKVIKIDDKMIIYEVSMNKYSKRDFILIYEDGKWKINTAFYHDLCGMKYFIY